MSDSFATPWTVALCPCDVPDKHTGLGSHFLLQGILPNQGENPSLLLGRQILYRWAIWEAQSQVYQVSKPGLQLWSVLFHTPGPELVLTCLLMSCTENYLLTKGQTFLSVTLCGFATDWLVTQDREALPRNERRKANQLHL